MSVKSKAQRIVNDIDKEFGINIAGYQNVDIEILKGRLEEFLDLEVDTEDLDDLGDLEDLNNLYDDALEDDSDNEEDKEFDA